MDTKETKNEMSEVVTKALDNIETVLKEQKSTQESVEKVTETVKGLQEKYEASIKVTKDEMQKQFDEFVTKSEQNNPVNSRPISFGDMVIKSLFDHEKELKEFSNGSRRELSIEVKADPKKKGGDFIGYDSFGLPVTPYNPAFPASVQGIITPPRHRHVAEVLPTGSVSGPGVYFIKESLYDPKAGYQEGEGAQKPHINIEFTTDYAPVVTIAAILYVSRQSMDDSAYLASYINQAAPEKLREFEDQEILYGDGNPNHLLGLFTSSNTKSTSSGEKNSWDKILNGLKDVAANGYDPDTILINTADAFELLKIKGTDDHYVFPDYTRADGRMMIGGRPIVPLSSVTANDFLVGQFSGSVQKLTRQGLNIRIFEQNKDQVETNMLTVRVEERIALPIYRPDAFVKGTF